MNTFFVEQVQGGAQDLGPDAAHHARVKRLQVDDRVQLTDGQGQIGIGRIVEISKASVKVGASDLQMLPAPPAIRLCVPIGDKDRMLWVAEKAV